MSLIARHFEEQGLPTLILGSALDILKAGKPPRVQFVNYPLGFESGRFNDKENQLAVVTEALRAFDEMSEATINSMNFEWSSGWDMLHEREKGKVDHRSERTMQPQYQNDADRIAAHA